MKAERIIERIKIWIIQLVFVVIIDVLIAVVVSLISRAVCGSSLDYSMYMRVLFIPLISFMNGFVSLVFTRNFIASAITNFLLCLILYLITNGIGFAILLWIPIYNINAVLSYVVALVSRSYRVE